MYKLFGISRRMFDTNGEEIVFSNGKGGYVYDTKGKSYIDMLLGYGPIILGHANKEYAKKIAESIEQGVLLPSYGERQYELADFICNYYQEHRLISFYQSGSDSLDSVFRICRYITGKKKLIRYGYIGWHDNLLSGGLHWHEPINSSSFFLPANSIPGIEEDQAYNWDGQSIASFEKLTENDNIACFIFDAYQLERKTVDVEGVINVCRKKGILVVLDETKTAGRVSTLGYYKDKLYFDFTILGKAISNGYPISLLLGKNSFQNVNFDSIKIAGTYARDCLCCSAVMTTTQLMKKGDCYRVIAETGKEIARKMNNHLKQKNVFNDIAVNVMLEGAILEFVYSDQFACDFQRRKQFAERMIRNGLLIQNGHCFYICAAHSECIDEIDSRFHNAVNEFFP